MLHCTCLCHSRTNLVLCDLVADLLIYMNYRLLPLSQGSCSKIQHIPRACLKLYICLFSCASNLHVNIYLQLNLCPSILIEKYLNEQNLFNELVFLSLGFIICYYLHECIAGGTLVTFCFIKVCCTLFEMRNHEIGSTYQV
jgi:hypothetical protein